MAIYGPTRKVLLLPGQCGVSSEHTTYTIRSVEPSDGPSGQIDTITFTSPGNDATFAVQIVSGGIDQTVSITTDGDATAAEAATALAAAIEANVLLSGLLDAVADGADTVITWRDTVEGDVALATNPGTAMALVTTAAADGTQFSWGQFVETTGSSTDGPDTMGPRKQMGTPAGSGTEFAVVVHTRDRAPRYIGDTVAGPLPGRAFSACFYNGNGNEIGVLTGETSVDDGDPVYVGSSGAEAGKAYASAGTGRVLTDFTFRAVVSPGVAAIYT